MISGIIQAHKNDPALLLTVGIGLSQKGWPSMSHDTTPQRRDRYSAAECAIARTLWEKNGRNLSKTARELSIPRTTLQFWISKWKSPQVIDHEGIALSVASALTQHSDTTALEASRSFRAFTNGTYTESDFAACLQSSANAIASHMGWPKVSRAFRDYALPNRKRIDLLFEHNDKTYTIIEVKSCSGQAFKAANWLLYPCVGQVLYYYETLIDCMSVNESSVRLCITADFDADVYFSRMLSRISVPIAFFNGSLFAREV